VVLTETNKVDDDAHCRSITAANPPAAIQSNIFRCQRARYNWTRMRRKA